MECFLRSFKVTVLPLDAGGWMAVCVIAVSSAPDLPSPQPCSECIREDTPAYINRALFPGLPCKHSWQVRRGHGIHAGVVCVCVCVIFSFLPVAMLCVFVSVFELFLFWTSVYGHVNTTLQRKGRSGGNLTQIHQSVKICESRVVIATHETCCVQVLERRLFFSSVAVAVSVKHCVGLLSPTPDLNPHPWTWSSWTQFLQFLFAEAWMFAFVECLR